MYRRFRQHDFRRCWDLAGFWDFAFLGDVEPDDVKLDQIEYDQIAAVPGNFDAMPDFPGARGLAAYRTTALISDDTHHQLLLDGVHHWSRVFINGQPLGDHIGGFTQFGYQLQDLPAGQAEIVILVDNRLDYDRCPLHLDYFDWYHFGGIARGVEWQRLGTHWINNLRIVTDDLKTRTVSIFIDYTAFDLPASHELLITCDGKQLIRETVELRNKYGKIKRTVKLDDAALWSPQQPNLHEIHVRFGEDDMRERIGLRTVEVHGRDILINGQPQQLLGFCRHEAHPQFGCGLPSQLIASDIQQIKAMGCNFIRGSHYPQDVRFLDLCDEMGICVWNETIGWQHTAEHLNDPKFMAAQITQCNEMVASSINRPSVIIWGILNESHSHDEACRAGYETLLAKLRELDPTRPLTYACNHPMDDKCLDLVDIISINTYPGWYGTELEDIAGHLDKISDRMDEIGQGDKPMILSEIGAGAIYGWRDDHETRWTEAYQARLLETVIRHIFFQGDRWCGLSIWQFGDCRTSHEVRKAIGRPRAFNNKGVVDEYRRPKQAFTTVKDLFQQLKNK